MRVAERNRRAEGSSQFFHCVIDQGTQYASVWSILVMVLWETRQFLPLSWYREEIKKDRHLTILKEETC
ncbi:hypothetical protein YTPLAS72_29700 [Nitrospira sp.]|nr:hypothetical protein YTPLAS72_29700 [Nitrospira sp.]